MPIKRWIIEYIYLFVTLKNHTKQMDGRPGTREQPTGNTNQHLETFQTSLVENLEVKMEQCIIDVEYTMVE